MEFTEKDVKRIGVVLLILLLGVLTFLIIKPVIFSIVAGLLLAYIFIPVNRWLAKIVKSTWLSAAIITLCLLVIVITPLWFLAPTLISRVSELFQVTQSINIRGILTSILPTISETIITQMTLAANNAMGQITSAILGSLTGLLLDFAVVALNMFLVLFIFFFTLKDEDKLMKFMSGLSPLNRAQEKALGVQFKEITRSIVYGQVVVGIFQGILAGLGFLFFGIPNVLILTLLAIVLSVIPIIGPSLIYIPAAIYLFVSGNPILGVGFLLYNLLIVTSVDNVLRSHLVAKKTQLSQAIVLVGMVGGLLVFGITGLILGPLIVAYLITFLEAYKKNTLSSFFAS